MNVEELIAKAKGLISEKNIAEAKKFIEDHKEELGEHYDKLVKSLGGDADGIIDKVKGFFGKD